MNQATVLGCSPKMLTRPNGIQSQTCWTVGPMEKGAQLSSGEHSSLPRMKMNQATVLGCSPKMLTRPNGIQSQTVGINTPVYLTLNPRQTRPKD
jgi:hypothetical protein